jgi:hypothetical protein
MVANPMRRGSRSPTKQLFISTPFFCLGFISVGFTSSSRSFNAPINTANIKGIWFSSASAQGRRKKTTYR